MDLLGFCSGHRIDCVEATIGYGGGGAIVMAVVDFTILLLQYKCDVCCGATYDTLALSTIALLHLKSLILG